MEIGVGLDHTLGMNWDDQANLAREAAELGYESIWTPENIGTDSFQVCARRWEASCDVVDGGLTTGIGVSPVMYRTPIGFAMSGGTMSQQTGGKFIMGIGAGSAYRPANRRDLGFPRVSALNLMRDYLTTIKGLVNGERVSHQGEFINYNNIRMAIRPAPNHAGVPRHPRPRDAAAGRRDRRRRLPQLVHARPDRMEPRPHRRGRGARGPRSVRGQGRGIHPHLRGR